MKADPHKKRPQTKRGGPRLFFTKCGRRVKTGLGAKKRQKESGVVGSGGVKNVRAGGTGKEDLHTTKAKRERHGGAGERRGNTRSIF